MFGLKKRGTFVGVLVLLVLATGRNSSGASPSISPDKFVDALNQIDSQHEDSYVSRHTWETERGVNWFVIWDAKVGDYRAVNLSYLHDLGDSDELTSNDDGDLFVADEYRHDSGGWSDFEDVDYDYYSDQYIGEDTGYAYEDEGQTYDVALIPRKKKNS